MIDLTPFLCAIWLMLFVTSITVLVWDIAHDQSIHYRLYMSCLVATLAVQLLWGMTL